MAPVISLVLDPLEINGNASNIGLIDPWVSSFLFTMICALFSGLRLQQLPTTRGCAVVER